MARINGMTTDLMMTSRKLPEIRNGQLQEQGDRPEAGRHERIGGEFRTLGAVTPDVDAPGRSAVDVLDRLENRRLTLRRVELAAGRFDRRLPDVVGQHPAERL